MNELIEMDTEAGKIWEGRVVDGKFPLRQWLGGSDHSSVFLTELPGQPGQKTAIKLIPAVAASSDVQIAHWRSASQLSHPNLLRLFDMGHCEIDGAVFLYVVMEYADEDLSQVLPTRRLEPSEASQLLPPVLDAISYLHGKRLVHSRIKPSNILAINDQVKLSIDHVLPIGESFDKTRAATVYDAPELRNSTISPAADMWSLGVTLVASLSQEPQLAAASNQGQIAIPDDMPDPFREIARACVQRQIGQRCTLSDIRSRLQGDSVRPVTPQTAPARVPLPPAQISNSSAPRSQTPVSRSDTKGSSALVRFGIPILIAFIIIIALAVPRLLNRRAEPSGTQSAKSSTSLPQENVPGSAGRTSASLPNPAQDGTSPGKVIHQVIPEVSAGARRTIRGKIRIDARLEVDPSGKVTNVRLVSNTSGSRYFANLAASAAQHWEFSAPRINGQPGASGWMLHFQFSRNATDATVTRIEER